MKTRMGVSRCCCGNFVPCLCEPNDLNHFDEFDTSTRDININYQFSGSFPDDRAETDWVWDGASGVTPNPNAGGTLQLIRNYNAGFGFSLGNYATLKFKLDSGLGPTTFSAFGNNWTPPAVSLSLWGSAPFLYGMVATRERTAAGLAIIRCVAETALGFTEIVHPGGDWSAGDRCRMELTNARYDSAAGSWYCALEWFLNGTSIHRVPEVVASGTSIIFTGCNRNYTLEYTGPTTNLPTVGEMSLMMGLSSVSYPPRFFTPAGTQPYDDLDNSVHWWFSAGDPVSDLTPDVYNLATPYTFELIDGVLPIGLALNPTTGAITGTPVGQETGTHSVTIRCEDSAGRRVKACGYRWKII